MWTQIDCSKEVTCPLIHISYSIQKKQNKTKQNTLKKDHRHKCKTKNIKLIEENRGGDFCDLWLGNDFLDTTPKA